MFKKELCRLKISPVMARGIGISVKKRQQWTVRSCDSIKMARIHFEMVFVPVVWH